MRHLQALGGDVGGVRVHAIGGLWYVLDMACIRKVWRRFNERHVKQCSNFVDWEQSRTDFTAYVETIVDIQLRLFSVSCLSSEGKEDLYNLWKKTSSISVELFADPLQESGVCLNYSCSWENDDLIGSVRGWTEDTDISIVSAGATPRNKREVVEPIMLTFERNVCGEIQFCRTALLPLQQESVSRIVE